MNLDQLRELIALCESETLEFKSTTGEATKAIRTACAMLNKSGGTILFGVRDSHLPAGSMHAYARLCTSKPIYDPCITPL